MPADKRDRNPMCLRVCESDCDRDCQGNVRLVGHALRTWGSVGGCICEGHDGDMYAPACYGRCVRPWAPWGLCSLAQYFLRSGEVEHGCESPVHGSTCTCMYAHTACRVLACFVRGVIACNHWLESHSLRQWLRRPHVAVVGGRSCAAIRPRLWPGGFGTFRKRTDMSGDALGTRGV